MQSESKTALKLDGLGKSKCKVSQKLPCKLDGLGKRKDKVSQCYADR